jgi:hypothetical protein
MLSTSAAVYRVGPCVIYVGHEREKILGSQPPNDFLLAFCYLSKLASDRSYSDKYCTRFSIMG